MIRQLMACCSLVLGISGASCMVAPDSRLGESGSLIDTDALLAITQANGSDEVDVRLTITDSRSQPTELESGQTVSVNGTVLADLDGVGTYTATLPEAETFIVQVRDPTRGVESTTVSGPAPFDIESPMSDELASLSGFTLQWSHADSNLSVEIEMTQLIFGELRSQIIRSSEDVGSVSFEPNDLAVFQQGASLSITVTKTRRQEGIRGFNSTVVPVSFSTTSTATPGS